MNGYLLDTHAVSDARRAHRHPRVAAFLAGLPPHATFLSVLTLGEIRRGAERKRRSDPVQAASIDRWLKQLQERFASQIVPIDLTTALLWGELSADRSRPAVDMLLAATAIAYGLVIVTRNLSDFAGLPVQCVNPWIA